MTDESTKLSDPDHEATLRRLGRQARARFQEEKSKRKEVVRLEHKELPTQIDNIASPSKLVVSATRKPVAATKRRRSVRSGWSPADSDDASKQVVDPWTPNVAHLSCDDSVRGNVVRVHGVPCDTTAGELRRFFSGLHPERVMILSPLDYIILEIDPLYGEDPEIERLPSTTRVLVKFESHTTAALAEQRSGEILNIQSKTTGDSIMSVRLIVTQLSKGLATFLIHRVAIDVPNLSTPLTTQHDIHARLDSRVSQILWAAVIRELDLNTNACIHEMGEILSLLPDKASKWNLRPDVQSVQERVDKLEALRDELRSLGPFPLGVTVDPSINQTDSIVRLTSSAVACLDDIIGNMKRQINRVHQMQWLKEQQRLRRD